MADSSGVAADHNLDLSLGNLSSRRGNGQISGNHFPNSASDQHLPPASNWRNGGTKPKVHVIFHKIRYLLVGSLLCSINFPLSCILITPFHSSLCI